MGTQQVNRTVILVTRAGLGTTLPADVDFGVEMLDKFFHTLERMADKPQAICFYTEGVKVLEKGSPVVLGLKLLESLGVSIVVCQSCVIRYGLQDRIAVGRIGGMPDIVQLLSQAEKVISI